MRTIVYGAGGIGGVIGGRLAEHGHEVLLIARGAHYEAIRARGLRIDSPAGSVVADATVVDRPAAIDFRDDDVVLLAMKSHDTAGALHDLAAVAPPSTPIVCAQNGVENERAALRLFSRVYAMCVMCPTGHLEPGVVQAYSTPTSGILDLGCYPSGVDEVAVDLAAALHASTFESLARPDIMRWKHTKLVMNLANSLEALCGRAAYDTPLLTMVRDEGMTVLRAAGIDFASEAEDRARRGDLLRIRPISGERRGGGSTWQSLQRGLGSVESDYLNGEIVLLGRLHGVPTPVNELLRRECNAAAQGGTAPGRVSPDDLLAQLDAVS